MPVVKWRFYDPIADEEYVFDINPNEGGTPSRRKSISYQSTAAPGGKTLIFEGQDEVPQLEFSGVALDMAQVDAFDAWFEKRHQIRVTNDRGKSYWVYITEFTPTRKRAVSHPDKHDYRIAATILDWPGT